jgi:tripartite-type tricarboxylate transporter receptor subunit TctC
MLKKIVFLFSLLLVGAPISFAQNTPLRILHGSNAGAPQDVMLRILADEMSKVSGRPVIVDAKPGASGQIAMAALKQAPADGNTIFSDGTGITSILQLPGHLHQWADFEPLYRIQLDPFAIYVLPERYKDFASLAKDMKINKDGVRIGGYAVGGPFQLVLMQIADKINGNFSWIAYDSGSKAVVAVMGDQIEAAMSNVSIAGTYLPKAKIVVQTGETRLAQLPDVPTLKELGIDMVRYHWRGMFIKKGTPESLIDDNFKLINTAIKSPRFQAYLKESGTIDGSMSRLAMKEMLADQAKMDYALLRKLDLVR